MKYWRVRLGLMACSFVVVWVLAASVWEKCLKVKLKDLKVVIWNENFWSEQWESIEYMYIDENRKWKWVARLVLKHELACGWGVRSVLQKYAQWLAVTYVNYPYFFNLMKIIKKNESFLFNILPPSQRRCHTWKMARDFRRCYFVC